MTAMYHSHASSWALTILFFAISYIMLRQDKTKIQKVTHMILRLFSLIMLVTGVGLLIGYSFALTFVIKGILAFVLISLMEMILVRGKKGKETKPLWMPFAVVLPLVVLLGFNVISL
ncbi:DUF1516 family protein [Ammoniphilus sp. CFH 90114]|nr:DUF1516 family protein [Ammoniphilus sp. CFH 90114]